MQARRAFRTAWLVVGLTLSPAVATPQPPPRSTDSSTTLSGYEIPTTEELLGTLKQRAEEAIKARRAQAPKLVEATTSLSQGFETNVNLDTSRKGDAYLEEALGLFVRPRPRPWLTFEGSYQARNTHFAEFRDNNTWSNTLGARARWTPSRRVSLEAGYEYEILNYPFDTSNSYFDDRVTVTLRHILTEWLFHEVSWQYLRRNYDTHKASDPSGTETPSVRADQRQTVAYELGAILGETVVRLRQDWFENLSNEGFQDFYDWQDYRVRVSASRPWWKKLLTTGSVSYERRNFAQRSVPTKNVAEEDDLVALSVSLFYELAHDWNLGYTWLWQEQVSNDPRVAYVDTIHQWGVYARF